MVLSLLGAIVIFTLVRMAVFEEDLKEGLVRTLVPFVGGYVFGCLIYAVLKNCGV